MIRFFQINDPARILFLLVLLLLIRIPAMLLNDGFWLQEIEWLVIGQDLNQGKLLYKELDTAIGPLSALMYQIIDVLFGQSRVALEIISMLFIAFQAVVLSLLFNRTEVLTERTFVPSLIYIFVASMAPDLFTLSPVLLSTTFVLMAFAQLIWNLKHGNTDQSILVMGAYIGIAALFYLPSLFFMLMILGALLFYSGTIVRRFILLLFGFALIVSMALAFYYIKDAAKSFLDYTFSYGLEINGSSTLPALDYLYIAAFPALLVLLGIVSLLPGTGFVNYQLKCHRTIFLWLISASLAWLFTKDASTHLYILLAGPASFYIAQYFLFFKKRWLLELLFYLLVFSCIATGYMRHHNLLSFFHPSSHYTFVQEEDSGDYGKLVVFGEDHRHYLSENNDHVTRYLDWMISKNYLSNPESLAQQTRLYHELSTEQPDVIIDYHGVVEQFRPFIPLLDEYKPTPVADGVLYKKD